MPQHESYRHLDQAEAGFSGKTGQGVCGVQLSLVFRQRQVEAILWPGCCGRASLTFFAVAPREPTTGKRAIGEDAVAVAGEGRENVTLDASSEDVLDAIDRIVAPGVTLNPADDGWVPPALDRAARRR